MAPRSFSVRFRLGLALVGVAIGALVTASPQAGQEISIRSIQVPSIAVPRVGVPGIFVPIVKQQPAPLQLPVMSRAEVEAHIEAAEKHLSYLPGQVLVKFKKGIGRSGQQRALSSLRGLPAVDGLEWIGDIALLKDPSQPDARVLAQQLSAQPEVAYAEPNYLRHKLVTPNDPSFAAQWNLQAINMPRAWDISPGGSNGLVVAVIDTGITSIAAQNVNVLTWNGFSIVSYAMPVGPSPDFSLSRFVSPRDFTISVVAPPAVTIDTDEHGTHVAGTVGEDTNNNLSLAGIAYNARIMPLKVCTSFWDEQFARSAAGISGRPALDAGDCQDSAIIAAIRFAADNGAQVINISLGGDSPSQATLDAMSYAIARGVFIAVANGNEFEDGNTIGYPAAYAPQLNGMMSVAATNRLEKRAFYSTTGPFTEISAPGGDGREGNVIFQATLRSSDKTEGVVVFPRFDRYNERGFQGTSMATPHIAGIAALIMSRGTTSPATVEAILRQTAKDIGTAGKDNDFGFGLVQPLRALLGQGVSR